MVMCVAVRNNVRNRVGRRRETVMCVAVSVMVPYMVGDKEGNGDVCCS